MLTATSTVLLLLLIPVIQWYIYLLLVLVLALAEAYRAYIRHPAQERVMQANGGMGFDCVRLDTRVEQESLYQRNLPTVLVTGQNRVS